MADNNEKKVENETKPQEEKKKLPQLGALEDDDEFEVSLRSYIGRQAAATRRPCDFEQLSARREGSVLLVLSFNSGPHMLQSPLSRFPAICGVRAP